MIQLVANPPARKESARTSRDKVYFACLNHPVFTLLPYAWGLLRAYAETSTVVRESYEFVDAFYGRPKLEEMVDRVDNPTVLGVSCYVWNMKLSMDLARAVKEKYPDCLMIAGGAHIPDQPHGFFQQYPYIDVLVHHEGEVAFQRILLELLRKQPDLTRVRGLTLNRDGVELSTGPEERLPRELNVPSPFLLGYFESMFADFRANQNRGLATNWETNRGCPYQCTFCDWGASFFQKLKRVDVSQLEKEIEYFGQHGFDLVFCADANFGLLERDLDLARLLAATKRKHGAPGEFWVNDAKYSDDRVFEINRVLHGARMSSGATLSMQSLNKATLQAIKRPAYSTEKYGEIKLRYAEQGIHTYTELILGLPHETKDSWITGYGRLLESGHHEDLRFYHATLLPNSELSTKESREKHGLRSVHKNMFLKEEWEVLIGSDTMSPSEWVECNVFSYWVQTLHCGGYTRFSSMYLHRQHGVAYHEFYHTLQKRLRDMPGSVLGTIQREIEQAHTRYINDTNSRNPVTLPFWNRDMYGERPELNQPPYVYATNALVWIWVAARIDAAYAELDAFLQQSYAEFYDERLVDMMRFQRDLMVTMEYNGAGIQREYQHNWYEYFFGSGALEPGRTRIEFTDVGLGQENDPFVAGDPKAFLRATLGPMMGYYTYRRFFHQPDKMLVVQG